MPRSVQYSSCSQLKGGDGGGLGCGEGGGGNGGLGDGGIGNRGDRGNEGEGEGEATIAGGVLAESMTAIADPPSSEWATVDAGAGPSESADEGKDDEPFG